ncbi:MAG: TrkA family potassium uptake protein [Pacificimonas sp.]
MSKRKRSFAVIGLGRFGSRVARELIAYGNNVIGIDVDERLVSPIADALTEAVIADARDEAALREAGVASYDAAIVAIGSNLEASVLCHMNLQSLGVRQITVKAFDMRHARILEALGAEDIVIPEQDAGEHIAQRLHNPLIIEYMSVCEGSYVALVDSPTRYTGQPLSMLNSKGGADVSIIGVMRSDTFLSPHTSEGLHAAKGDRLLLQGSRADIRNFADAG